MEYLMMALTTASSSVAHLVPILDGADQTQVKSSLLTSTDATATPTISPTSTTALVTANPTTSPPPGNSANTVDNLILTPKWGESVPFGQIYTITWNATTSRSEPISVFYKMVDTGPSDAISISACQGLSNTPGTVMRCPWPVLPAQLLASINTGFEIILVWNSTGSGYQVSNQFGIFNMSLGATPTSTSTTISNATPTPSSITTKTASPNSRNVSLGFGLGLGIPLFLLGLTGLFIFWRRRRAQSVEKGTDLSHRSNLPPYQSRLMQASMNPKTRDLETPDLLRNYRNAEHFNFKPSNAF